MKIFLQIQKYVSDKIYNLAEIIYFFYGIFIFLRYLCTRYLRIVSSRLGSGLAKAWVRLGQGWLMLSTGLAQAWIRLSSDLTDNFLSFDGSIYGKNKYPFYILKYDFFICNFKCANVFECEVFIEFCWFEF